MRKEQDDTVDPCLAALVVTYGNTNRRRRALDRDLFVLGRSPGCDLSLVSPEVAPVHCILFRSGGAWTVRDCSGRPGTMVNGKVVQEVGLHDTDALQVGTFSFQLQLPYEPDRPGQAPRDRPASAAGPLADEIEHLRRSRRRLGEMALDMRRQLQELKARQVPKNDSALEASKMEELEFKEKQLQLSQEEVADRSRQLDDEEKALAETRIAIEGDSDALQKMRSRCERELTKARKDAEAEIQLRWEEFKQRCQKAEEDQQRTLSNLQRRQATMAAVAAPTSTLPDEESRLLERRREELACFARHLQRSRQRLQDNEKLEAEIVQLRAKMAAAAAAPVAEQVPDLSVELDALERENERLRQDNTELRRKLTAPRQDEEMRVQFVKLEGQMAGLRKQAELAAAAEQEQRNRLTSLEKEMRDRDNLIVQLQERLTKGGVWDTATFNALEAELIFNRRELERDRQILADQAAQLRERQAELKDAGREAEVQMSRERAQLARERAELTRLRDEVRAQQDRKQRNSNVRDPLAALRSQEADTVVDGKIEESPKPAAAKARLTSQRRRSET